MILFAAYVFFDLCWLIAFGLGVWSIALMVITGLIVGIIALIISDEPSEEHVAGEYWEDY